MKLKITFLNYQENVYSSVNYARGKNELFLFSLQKVRLKIPFTWKGYQRTYNQKCQKRYYRDVLDI